MDALLLDLDNWDLRIDEFNNIALATGRYSLAQNVASAVRLWTDDQYYQLDKGIPYQNILGKQFPLSLLKNLMQRQALTVQGVVDARVVFDSFTDRKLTGRILFIDETGVENGISF